MRYFVFGGMDVEEEVTSTSFSTFAFVSDESVGQRVNR